MLLMPESLCRCRPCRGKGYGGAAGLTAAVQAAPNGGPAAEALPCSPAAAAM